MITYRAACRTTRPAWTTGLTGRFAIGAALMATASMAAASMLAVEITRVYTGWALYAESIRPVCVMYAIMAWVGGVAICAVDRLEQFHDRTIVELHQLTVRDLASLHATVRHAVAGMSQLEVLREEVDELGRAVADASTAAAIIAHATGRPVHPVPDLHPRRSTERV